MPNYGYAFTARMKRLQEELENQAEKKRRRRRALNVVFSMTVGETCAAWMLMFGLALLGYPRFGFWGLWVVCSGVSSLLAAGVHGGMHGIARSYAEPVK